MADEVVDEVAGGLIVGAGVLHSLGAVLWSAAALAWLLLTLAAARRERAVGRRAMDLLGAGGRPGRSWGRGRGEGRAGPGGEGLGGKGLGGRAWLRRWGDAESGRRAQARRWLTVAGVVGAGWALVGGVAGCVVGVAAGCCVWRMQPGADRKDEADTARAARQLPLAADLLVACVAAGAGPVVAAQAVGESLGGPVGERLAWGAAQVRLGGAPADAWRRVGEIPGADALARLLERTTESGSPAAGPVARFAADCRTEQGRTATARARRAAVQMTAPVGLCFLPAFLAIGVVPVVIGLAGGLMSGQ
ncbi:type II secretion system F family protein [Streptomyces flavofungini]|uniref:type II secretion system F family protein n=1 Tax=Streptomyces flavofungini TaxID=68200 RepID=UPI0025B0CE23|nr:type II secretion system F family protein [Streptomyces flavofungini]WJV51320.1 type II secretion system F family protein [Streptomyces flavofungini]